MVAPDGRESYVTDDASMCECRAPDRQRFSARKAMMARGGGRGGRMTTSWVRVAVAASWCSLGLVSARVASCHA